MTKSRLEAFSDGVLAIIITIMVLELKVPHEPTLDALQPLGPVILSYILSFVYVGIYWNNHHHLFQAVRTVSGPTLWANLHLLFWLSLIPFATTWLGETRFSAGPVGLYGVILLGSAVAYTILVKTLLKVHPKDSALAIAIGRDTKGNISLACYIGALGAALISQYVPWAPYVSCALYVVVALIWLAPDQRIERVLEPPKRPD
jgi:uncharacterized membrane protein